MEANVKVVTEFRRLECQTSETLVRWFRRPVQPLVHVPHRGVSYDRRRCGLRQSLRHHQSLGLAVFQSQLGLREFVLSALVAIDADNPVASTKCCWLAWCCFELHRRLCGALGSLSRPRRNYFDIRIIALDSQRRSVGTI